MAKKIGVIIDFLNDKYERQLNEAAAKCGYEVVYFPSSAAAVGNVDECEILYGHCSRKVVKSAKSLKWYCTCWAGVDHFCDDGLYQNPDCLLSNSSGAYGTTISEHLIMVCLMLLRRQMEYTEIIRAGGWETLPGGIRSLHGARITVLGTGDIGTEFARRAQAFHPACITGVRRTVKPSDPAFTAIHAIAELDSVLPETDILVMALPSTAETVGILSRERIALLPDSAFVVNVGRGTAIDQEALCDALNAGQLAGAGEALLHGTLHHMPHADEIVPNVGTLIHLYVLHQIHIAVLAELQNLGKGVFHVSLLALIIFLPALDNDVAAADTLHADAAQLLALPPGDEVQGVGMLQDPGVLL